MRRRTGFYCNSKRTIWATKAPTPKKLHDRISVRIRKAIPIAKQKDDMGNISHFTLAFMCQFPIPKKDKKPRKS